VRTQCQRNHLKVAMGDGLGVKEMNPADEFVANANKLRIVESRSFEVVGQIPTAAVFHDHVEVAAGVPRDAIQRKNRGMAQLGQHGYLQEPGRGSNVRQRAARPSKCASISEKEPPTCSREGGPSLKIKIFVLF
jgi:hypothetical protein